jgi:hypothetical protein
VLTVFLRDLWAVGSIAGWEESWPVGMADRTVGVLAGDAEWRCRLRPARVDIARVTGASTREPADATVDGQPSLVLLWLWGRAPDDAVVLGGDPDVIRTLRGRLQMATQ